MAAIAGNKCHYHYYYSFLAQHENKRVRGLAVSLVSSRSSPFFVFSAISCLSSFRKKRKSPERPRRGRGISAGGGAVRVSEKGKKERKKGVKKNGKALFTRVCFVCAVQCSPFWQTE